MRIMNVKEACRTQRFDQDLDASGSEVILREQVTQWSMNTPIDFHWS